MSRGPFIQDFGKRVRELREAARLSQEDLAFEAGLHRTAISHIEQATRSSTLETVEKLARALNVQPSELIPKIKRAKK
ncbi:MAG: helix-turn-helix transcriptional regulator [Planctomycetota bacterium]